MTVRPLSLRPVAQSTFTIVCNGASDSPPAAAVREYLVAGGARRVTTVYHPLLPECEPRHTVTVYEPDRSPRQRSLPLPSRPPLTYAFDPFVPLRFERVDGWIGFNNLGAARGLLERRRGRAGRVLYWAVDFVPDRFGRGLLTRLYDGLDQLCCSRVDARFEVSSTALAARNARHRLDGTAAPAHVAPMGAWLARVPVTAEDGWRARRVIFLGHLVPRQGVRMLVDALSVLKSRGVEVTADIAGQGPLEGELRQAVEQAGLVDRVRFLGFIADHRELEAFVATGSVAVAPYAPDKDSFTRYADPSKVRAYMAGGVPVVMTDVPPNAAELGEQGGAEIVPYDAEALAAAIERTLASPEEWAARRRSALDYARGFDWERIVERALGAAGFVS